MADVKLTQPITLRDFSRGLYSDVENPLRPLNAVSGALNVHFDRLPLIQQRKGYTILATQISGSQGSITFNPTAGVDGHVERALPITGSVNTLVIAGGGGGGSDSGGAGGAGGGGAGGYQANTTFVVTDQAYTITIGAGGSGGSSGARGTNGNNSIFDTITAEAGGSGGGSGSSVGNDGGSGGGGAALNNGTRGQGTVGQGNEGVNGNDASNLGGAGGGAGAAGSGIGGGAGTSNSISGSSVTYSEGGNGTTGTKGGSTIDPGSGGTGGGSNGDGGDGDAGQNGIVIIRYATDGSDGITTDSTGGTITTDGSDTIHTFTSSGTFTAVITSEESFSDIRSSAGSASADGETSEKVVKIKTTTTTDKFDEVRRGDLVFDTSAIADPAVIDTAKLRIFVNSKVETLTSQSLSVVTTTTASNTALANADYGNFGNTKIASDKTLASLTTSAYNEYTLTSFGGINKTGFTKIGLRLASDVSGSVTWASAVEASVNIDFAEGTNTPELVIESTVGTNILGLHQFLDADGTDNQVMVQAGGIMYFLDGSSWTQIDDSRSSIDKERFLNALDLVFYTSKLSGMKTWTGNSGESPGTTNAVGAPSTAFMEFFKNKVYAFSTTSDPDRLFLSSTANNALAITWDTTNDTIDINPSDGQNGSGLKRVGSELLIFKRDYVYRFFGLAGLDPDPLINVGTYSHESIVTNKAGAFWHHPSGIYLYAGGKPSEVSRPIDDFIRAVDRTEYGNIAGWNDSDGDHVYESVGDLTFGSIVFTNVVLRYTISSQVWTVYSYASRFLRGIVRDTGTNLDILVGDTNSTIYQLNVGDTDDGAAIFYDLKTRWIEVVSLAYTQIIKQVASYSTLHRGMMLSWQADDDSETTWREIAKLDKFVFISRNDLAVKGRRVRFRISGSNRKEQWIWQGVDILNSIVRVPKS